MLYKISYKHILFMLFVITSISIFSFYLLIKYNLYNVFDYLLFLISIPFLIFGVLDLNKNSINSYNLFSIIYSFLLMINSLHISYLQEDKNIFSIFVLISPMIISIFLLFFIENFSTNLKLKKINLINFDFIFYLLFFVYIVLQFYIFATVGFRFEYYLQGEFGASGLEHFTVEGISGLLLVLKWTVVALSLKMTPKARNITFILMVILSILSMVRGDVIRLAIIYFIFTIYNNRKVNKRYMILLFVFLLIMFVELGNLRSSLGGRIPFDISIMLQSVIYNDYVSWLYAYTAINFDVLLEYENFKAGSSFFNNLFNGIDWSIYSQPHLNGLNAGTIFSFALNGSTDFVSYLFKVTLLIIMYSVLVLIALATKNISLYIMLISLNLLSIFGNYLFNKYFLVSILLISFIYFISSKKGIKSENNLR